MRSTFKQLYYINRSRVKADGTTAVWCRITIDGRQAVLSTGIHCRPEDWNGRKGEVREVRTNGRLEQFRRHIESVYETILKEQGVISAELLRNTLYMESSMPATLLNTGQEELERLKRRSVEIGSRSTYRQSVVFHDSLRQYVESHGRKDIPLEDVTEQFGRNYKTFLLKDLGCSTNKMNKCLCWLNRLLYLAVDKEIIRVNPCEDVEYEKRNPPRLKHISRNELKRLMATPFEDGKMELARRMFIFSSFTGLAYVDVYKLYPHHIGEAADGRKYIRKKRGKTNVEAFVPLHPIAERIMSLYNISDDTKPVFPLPVRDVLWHEVHSIGNALEFEENLSHHQARHTFGTLLVSAGISIESIAKMMGHTSITSSQIYAKITDDKISEDMDKLMERREAMRQTNDNNR